MLFALSLLELTMSEPRAPYRMTYTNGRAARGALRQEVKRLASTSSGRYAGPEPGLIRSLMSLQGWSQAWVADVLRVNVSTVRRWCTDRDSEQASEIPFAAWRLLLLSAGVVSVDGLDSPSRSAY